MLKKFEKFVLEKEEIIVKYLLLKMWNWEWFFKDDKRVFLNCVFSLIGISNFVKFIWLKSYVGILGKLFVFFFC